jgi:hypothetical protein
MKENRADVIFHPVRIRIVQALLGDRKLTAQQLLEILEGPSIATLYRHLNRMVGAGIVAVVEERPIRGALEKVYALAHDQAASFTAKEVRQISREDRMHHFTTLIGTLLNDFGRYLDQEASRRKEETVIIWQDALHVTHEEARQIGKILKEALTPYIKNPPNASRHRQLLTTIMLPVVEMMDAPEDSD